MTNSIRYFATAGVIAMALSSSIAMAQSASTDPATAPIVPNNLTVPPGNTLFFKGQAQGWQNYICMPSPVGVSWTFFSPQANVFLDLKLPETAFRQQILTHFLSPNPDEKGTGRATWQSSFDSSATWGKSLQSSSDPGYVAAGAIPWLLLQAVGTRTGPNGGDLMAHTTYVQRLNTAGGVMPATGCAGIENLGATALVPYSAEYYFYKATAPPK